MNALRWRPIAEWLDDAPGHIRSYADLWVRDDTGSSWREAEAWFNKSAGHWMVSDGLGGSEPIGAATPTHFMIVEGPGE